MKKQIRWKLMTDKYNTPFLLGYLSKSHVCNGAYIYVAFPNTHDQWPKEYHFWRVDLHDTRLMVHGTVKDLDEAKEKCELAIAIHKEYSDKLNDLQFKKQTL